jgi:predicted permease
MRWIRKWLERRLEETDLRDELTAHLAIEQAEQRQEGKSPEEAERAARAAFGNLTKTQENVLEIWGWAGFERLLQDCRFGVRLLLRSPGWTAVVCLTLALGVGISAAIFSVAYGVLLEPLPYREPDRIMVVSPTTAQNSKERFNANPALWLYWREHLTAIEDLALTRPVANFNLTGNGSPERLEGARITFNVPRVLGIKPLLGRLFTESEQLSDARVVLLNYGLWLRRFGADRSVLGRKIQLNGEPFEVVGVMPPEFRYPDGTFEVWAPLYLPPSIIGHGHDYGFLCIGRLKPGVTVERAQAELRGLMRRLAEEFPASYRDGNEWIGGLLEPLAQNQAAALRPTLLVLTAAVACLLLVGCMNLAVLLIARASGRSREILVRIALGATGGRLRRQLLAEAVPLGLLGATGGILLAYWILRLLIPLLPSNFPRIESFGLNGTVLAFALLCGLGIVILASLLPSRLSSAVHLSGALQGNARTIAPGARIRDLLVMGQVAVAVLLLFSGLLFARSFGALLSVHPGFSEEGVLTMHLAVSRAKFPQDAQVAEYYRRLIERVKTVPGVLEAGLVNRLPLSGLTQTGGIEFEGRETTVMADWRSVTPGYFGAIGIPLLRGRPFSEADRADTVPVGLIDAELAQRVFGHENPIGRRFRRNFTPGQLNDEPWSEIVGVAGHVRNDSLEKDPRPQVYWPETQRTQDRAALVIRTAGQPLTYAKAVVAQIHRENPEQPVYEVRAMSDWVARSLRTRTLTTGLISLFGFASVALACLGLYGAVSYATGLRLREFAIRLALGATKAEVSRLVFRQVGFITGLGVVIGLALCWPAGHALRGFLFGVGSLDALSWILAPALLICVAVLAGLGPALRAAKADPAQTLRAD